MSRHLVVMGVSASGKTTLARALAEHLGWAFAEGDDFHPPANVAKMRGGTPLTDADRWPWLESLRDWMTAQGRQGHSTVLSCSALKQAYRDLLRGAEGEVSFIHLTGTPELLAERMKGRSGHFMPTGLLASQLATLEPPDASEGALTLDIAAPPEELVRQALAWIGEGRGTRQTPKKDPRRSRG